MMCRSWIDRRCVRPALTALAVAMLAACATNKEKILPHSETTMLDVWREQTGRSGARQLLNARATLRRPLTAIDGQHTLTPNENYTRTAANEIESQFKRLPNPDLVMYVFPHLAGSEHVPVPGYSTVFPLHERVQYALPGERTQDY